MDERDSAEFVERLLWRSCGQALRSFHTADEMLQALAATYARHGMTNDLEMHRPGRYQAWQEN